MYELINHAHNDWLEVTLETGLLGLVLVVAFFIWFARASARLLAGETSFDKRVGQAACIAIALVSLHALWEYPLRTIALSTLFALCCALLTESREPISSIPTRGRRHARSASTAVNSANLTVTRYSTRSP
jgi:O-antigen ligase